MAGPGDSVCLGRTTGRIARNRKKIPQAVIMAFKRMALKRPAGRVSLSIHFDGWESGSDHSAENRFIASCLPCASNLPANVINSH